LNVKGQVVVRAVVQRVKRSSVRVKHREVGCIGAGLLVFLGIAQQDTEEDLIYLVSKIITLRTFEDQDRKMNLSILDVSGEMLVVSQFTLLADCRKGRRPSFTEAAQPDIAQALYNNFISRVQQRGIRVASGIFQAEMEVAIVNDGPVTFLLDSRRLF
jgi:D-tyrosyl-tRNA(Tyr) deacylase